MSSRSQILVDTAGITSRIRGAGLKATPQRLVIYGELMRTREHPTVEALHQAVLQRMPALPLATVYKTIESLELAGLVAEVSIPGNARRYDANVGRHHHLVCTRCHRVTDFYDHALDGVRPRAALNGFQPKEIKVQILGTCTKCQRAKCQPAAGRAQPTP